MKLAWLLVVVCLASGCLSAPLQRDKNYPAAWPDISTLGSDGKGLEGSYANDGIAAGGAGPTILLTSILPNAAGRAPRETKIVSLKAMPGKPDSHGDSQGRLQITLQGDVPYHYECGCFCVRGNVFFVQSAEGGGVPYLAAGGGQCNVTLSKAVDGSLIAKIESLGAGVIVIVPYYSHSLMWARFTRVGD